MKASLKTLLISSPLVIGGLELGLRLIGYSAPALGMPDRITGWSLRPGAEGVVRNENKRGVYVRINGDGLRDREHRIAKPASTLRIAVVGDSLCQATEVPLEKTFWAILEDKLSRCSAPGNKVEVINFGVAGYSTAQELLMLRSRVWKYQPDIVLLAFTGSDVSENFRPLSGQPLSPYFIHKDNQLVQDDSFRSLIRHEWLRNKWAGAAQHLRTLELVRELVQRARQSARSIPGNDKLYGEPVDREWQEAWSITEDLIRLFHLETVQHRAAFWIVTMSNDIQVHPEPKVRDEFRRKSGATDLFYPDRRIQGLCARENIPCISLAEALAGYAEREHVLLHGFAPRLGFGHWNEDGHRVAGELIADRLCRDVLGQTAIQHAQKTDSTSGR